MSFSSIPARVQRQAAARPSNPAYFVREADGWKPTSWATYAEQIRTAAAALIALGFPAGGTVSILGFNRPEWVIADIASMAAGGAPAGIYTTNSAEECRYIIDHSGSSFVLVEDEAQYRKIASIRDRLPNLRWIVTMRGAAPISDPNVLSWDDFMARATDAGRVELDRRTAAIDPNSIGTLIYTSGTTGPPKAVMLSHNNLSWTADCAVEIAEAREGDCTLSYLPLSHIAEQMFSIHVPVSAGMAVYFARSIEKVPDDLKEVQPTVFFGVPRIWEKFNAGIRTKLADVKGAKATLIAWARRVAHEATLLRAAGREPGPLLRAQHTLARKLVFSKLHDAIGLGRARVCVSGAAPIAPDVLDFFASLDILVHEVYGQSEGCGPTSFNRPGRTRLGSVGPAIPGCEVRIAEDGEILARGPNIFLGYLKDQEATDETLIDGWLHSGDLGSFDADGYLFITGRKKDILITAGGKNIAPKNLEADLKSCDLIAEAVVIGDRRKFLSALVVLNPDGVDRLAHEKGFDANAMPRPQALVDAIQAHLDKINQHYARVEQIKKFTILPRALTIENGELTPTLKVKRRIVNENWKVEIEAMYAGDES
jgi:long-chain acyl-CoA synthetase